MLSPPQAFVNILFIYVLSPVHLCNVVSSYLLQAILGNITCKRHSQVVAQGAQLATLVSQVVDEFRVLAVFARQNLLEFKDWRVDGDRAVALKDRLDYK